MNQLRKIHHRRLLSRHGFTLLEVMISTVLSSVVLVLVYSSVDVAARLSRAGTQSVVNDSVARTVLFRIHDDLKTAPVPAGHYLASTTGDAFTSDRFRNFVKRDEVVAPSIKVSRDFLLLQSAWSTSALQNQADRSGTLSGKKYIAYFVSRDAFESELGDHLRSVGLTLVGSDLDFQPTAAFHRCLLVRDSGRGAFRLVDVDSMFDREEIDSVAFRVFNGSSWSIPISAAVEPPLAIESSVHLRTDAVSGAASNNNTSKTSYPARGDYSLVTTVRHFKSVSR